MNAQEQQEECKYDSDLEQNSSLFLDFFMDMNVHHAYDHFPNHFEHAVKDNCIDNYIFIVDHNQNVLTPTIQLSRDHFSEEETVTLDDKELISKEQ